MIKRLPLPLLLMATLMGGCEAINGPTPIGPAPIGNAPETNRPITQKSLTLDLNKAELFTVNSYFSPLAYGPTKTFYQFFDKNIIITFSMDNSSMAVPLTGTLYRFRDGVDKSGLKKWLNNQYSDGLFADAPKPQSQTDLGPYVTILSRTSAPQIGKSDGNLYTPVTIRFAVAPFSHGNIASTAYEGQFKVYVLEGDGATYIPKK